MSFATRSHAQTYTWNNTGSDITAASSWSPVGGPPGSTNLAQFNPNGSLPGTAVIDPSVTGNVSYLGLTLGQNQNLGGWNFTGNNTITLGGSGSTGLTTYGPATYTFNGPSLAGASSANLASIKTTNGSTLVLAGSSTATSNIATQIALGGGTLALDNTGDNSSSRLSTTTGLFFQSGTLELRGNASAATNFSLGALANTNSAGFNTIRLVPGSGQQLTVNFNNTGASFSTRLSTFSAFQVVATSGTLGGGGAADPKVTFTGTPILGANGLLANSTGGTFGYFTVSDATGTDFATWSSTKGVFAAGATKSGSALASIGGTATDRVFYTPGAGTDSVSTPQTIGSIRITPTAAGATLAMGSNNLVTNALMLNGNNDFTITGTGSFGATGTRYIYVNDANTTLNTSLSMVNGTNPTSAIGPGFLVFTSSSAVQDAGQSGSSSNRFDLMGGITVRGTNANFGFQVAAAGNDAFAAVNFRGGVIEIAGGSNGSGTSADFTRALGTADGQVRWEGGNGGFSAFGANASVNIGGASAGLQWGATNFVTDGYALKFGSTQSNAILQWQNPLGLDANGLPGSYLVREINVTAGTGGDKTQLAGVVSGSSSTDLLKTGTGVLELLAQNTYQGNTLVQGGTLVVGTGGSIGTSGSAAGNVIVGKGATFAGVSAAGNTTVTTGSSGVINVNPGGAIRGGNPTVSADGTGTLSTNASVTINSNATDSGILRVEASRTGANAANTSLINLNGASSVFNLNPGSGNKFVIDLVNGANALQANETYTVTLATVATAGNLKLNGSSLGAGSTIAATNYTLQSSAFSFTGVGLTVDSSGTSLQLTFTTVPVPEPAAVLAIATGALLLGRKVRRKFAKGEPAAAA